MPCLTRMAPSVCFHSVEHLATIIFMHGLGDNAQGW